MAQLLHMNTRESSNSRGLLQPGERAERVDFNPRTGDYRVFEVSCDATAAGSEILTLNLYRQAPGFGRRKFPVLMLVRGSVGVAGHTPIETFTCDAGNDAMPLPHIMRQLNTIITALQQNKTPSDALLLPFLSAQSQQAWNQPIASEGT